MNEVGETGDNDDANSRHMREAVASRWHTGV